MFGRSQTFFGVTTVALSSSYQTEKAKEPTKLPHNIYSQKKEGTFSAILVVEGTELHVIHEVCCLITQLSMYIQLKVLGATRMIR